MYMYVRHTFMMLVALSSAAFLVHARWTTAPRTPTSTAYRCGDRSILRANARSPTNAR